MINMCKTYILLALLSGIILISGLAIAGRIGLFIALLLVMSMHIFGYWNADRLILRMHCAVEVDSFSSPVLYGVMHRLSKSACLPMPRVYIIDHPQPNAFATGRNPQHSSVAVTTGLLKMLDRDELSGVLAHELAHIGNRDVLLMMVTSSLAGTISMLAHSSLFFGRSVRNDSSPFFNLPSSFLMFILAPFAASLLQLAISRNREYVADRRGSEICGRPLALASALEKIAGGVRLISNISAERHPATALLFIVNPLCGARMDNFFSTHPSVENRIVKLEAFARILPRRVRYFPVPTVTLVSRRD